MLFDLIHLGTNLRICQDQPVDPADLVHPDWVGLASNQRMLIVGTDVGWIG